MLYSFQYHSFITDATGYVDQHIQYLPFGELFISQRNSTFDSRYKFTAKELDNETQYTYFGARYLDSDISIWLSVDPMADQRPWLSPYNYCQLNPIGRIDPTGALDWEPVIGNNGNVSYKAEKGDNLLTFKSQYGLSHQDAYQIFNEAGIDPTTHDLAGQSIDGSAVKKVTGSDVLKLDWNSSRATDQRKVFHIGFALLYDFNKGTGGCGMQLNDFISGMPQTIGANSTFSTKPEFHYNIFKEEYFKYDSFYFPAQGGGKIPISLLVSTASGKTYLCFGDESGTSQVNTYNYNAFHPNGKTLSEQHTQLQVIMISVDKKYSNLFEKNYWRK